MDIANEEKCIAESYQVFWLTPNVLMANHILAFNDNARADLGSIFSARFTRISAFS